MSIAINTLHRNKIYYDSVYKGKNKSEKKTISSLEMLDLVSYNNVLIDDNAQQATGHAGRDWSSNFEDYESSKLRK